MLAAMKSWFPGVSVTAKMMKPATPTMAGTVAKPIEAIGTSAIPARVTGIGPKRSTRCPAGTPAMIPTSGPTAIARPMSALSSPSPRVS